MLDPKEVAQVLEQERDKHTINALVERMARDGFSLGAYFNEIDQREQPVKWYLTWTLSHYFDAYPHAPLATQELIWKALQQTDHKGMLRDYWRMLTCFDVDEEIAGAVYDKALLTCASPVHAVAVRVHAMQVAFNIAKAYPELLEEVLQVLLQLPEEDEKGIISRKNKLIQAIKESLRAQARS